MPEIAELQDCTTVICCEGPPACLLDGDAAIENQIAGCPLCRRIALHPDGSETEYRLPVQ